MITNQILTENEKRMYTNSIKGFKLIYSMTNAQVIVCVRRFPYPPGSYLWGY